MHTHVHLLINEECYSGCSIILLLVNEAQQDRNNCPRFEFCWKPDNFLTHTHAYAVPHRVSHIHMHTYKEAHTHTAVHFVISVLRL